MGERQAERIKRLESTFLTPCCYQEPVGRHRSEAAMEMKKEITGFVAQGRTDREIIDFYRQKYGAKILVEPEGALWWWMHIVPWVVLALATVFLIVLLRRMRRAAPEGAV
jgi:cytochrome c-type biogenesis protein CcmH